MLDQNVLKTGKTAPAFLLRDLDGHPHALSHYRGQVVVLNFWSAECPWSKRADEKIQELMQAWGSQVTLISIAPNANEPLEKIKVVSQDRNLPLVLHDPDRSVTEQYGAEMTPHIFVIDQVGVLRYQGAFDDVTFRQRTPTKNYLKLTVEALLAGDSPEEISVPAYGCTIVYYEQG